MNMSTDVIQSSLVSTDRKNVIVLLNFNYAILSILLFPRYFPTIFRMPINSDNTRLVQRITT